MARFDGDNYYNCLPLEDGMLLVAVDNHNLAPGPLSYKLTIDAPDGAFSDGEMNVTTPGYLGILLPRGYKKVIYPELSSDSGQIAAEESKNMIPVYTEEADCNRVSYVEGDPEPQPDPEQLRQMAYRAEADQYLLAYEGYIAEGKIAEADEQKALYLAKKAEIRERYPDK